MDVKRRWMSCFELRLATTFVLFCVFHHNLGLCWSPNSEGLALLRFKERVIEDPFGALSSWKYNGDGDLNPCCWFGVECSDGKVVTLNLRDLQLGGTLAPELSKLTYIQVIILRNNSFTGIIPKDIGELKALEVLDLGHNNFSGQFPIDLGNNFSLSILLLDNNKYIGSTAPEIHELGILSESQVDESLLSGAAEMASCKEQPCLWDQGLRRILQATGSFGPTRNKRSTRGRRNSRSPPTSSFSSSPSPSPQPSFSAAPFSSPVAAPLSSISVPPSIPMSVSPSPSEFSIPSPAPSFPKSPAPKPSVDPEVVSRPQHTSPVSLPPAPSPSEAPKDEKNFRRYMVYVLGGIAGAIVLVVIGSLMYFFCRNNKVVTVKPWATGLSGQLQKAFVTGVPKLQRSELETACEDFSNIIGSLPNGTVYKGTLSSGVEIAVTATAARSGGHWSENVETQFRNKACQVIDTLSKINHKNFVNLIGYCKEENPFTRMMVFEYAPNGTLFEHLHIKESEHLDWSMRLRIAMGIAYCLEYMYQLNPPIVHRNLQSSSVYLTEDYAAKLSDFNFWNEVIAAKKGESEPSDLQSSDEDEDCIFSFGLILFEMITGKLLPYSDGNGSLENWVTGCLKEGKPHTEMVDRTLKSYGEKELEKLFALMKDCILSDPTQRPAVKEVVSRLKEITAMGPDGAMPKTSPLWWAELEILSTDSI
nr:probable inactive receptor-like protein kinase At3g56050 [Ipomoea batatas]